MRKSASRKSSQYVYSLITHSRLLVLALTLLLTFSPLPTLASTPIDSEIKTDRPQWYAFASYFEVYEVSPPQHFISQITKVIEKEKLSSDARINFYLLRHITTVKPIESTEELQAYERAIGNITNKSDIGAYLYQGTNYANPHAATSVNGVTYVYDNNGNLTSDSTWTHSWNYRNELANSYSYARDNPVKHVDKSCYWLAKTFLNA